MLGEDDSGFELLGKRRGNEARDIPELIDGRLIASVKQDRGVVSGRINVLKIVQITDGECLRGVRVVAPVERHCDSTRSVGRVSSNLVAVVALHVSGWRLAHIRKRHAQ
jgi:hypothetical protein